MQEFGRLFLGGAFAHKPKIAYSNTYTKKIVHIKPREYSMKRLSLLLGVLLAPLQALQSTPAIPTKDLIIILDYGQSEEQLRTGSSPTIHGHQIEGLAKLGAMTSTLLPALYQQTAPILVSRSMLHSILKRKEIFHDCLTKDIAELSRKYDRQTITQAPSLGLFKQHCVYAQKMYKTIQQELSEICKQGNTTENTAMKTLATKHPYLESSAPRSLHVYSGEKRSMNEGLHKELQAYALCYYAPLSPEHFIMKEVSQELILLLPKKSALKDSYDYKESTALTPLEKLIGIEVNHLKDIKDIQYLLQKTPITYGIPLSDNLRHLLIPKKEGSTHVWAVYITGHGLPSYPERRRIEHLKQLKCFYDQQIAATIARKPQEKSALALRHRLIQEELAKTELILAHLPTTHERIICSVTVDEFKNVLSFLNTELSTSILLYTSCYGGGEHLVAPYQGNTKVLNFDCISGSLSDTVSFQTTPMLLLPPYKSSKVSTKTMIEGINQDSIDIQRKCLAPYSSIHFDEFFKKVREPKRDAFTLIHCLHPYTEQGKIMADSLENIALERPAGATSFTVVSKGNSVAHASSQEFGTAVDVALLTERRYGQVRLVQNVPSFVSLTAGPAYHVIDALEAPDQTLVQLVKSFLELPTLSTPKVFWVKKLTCKKETPPPFFLPFEFFKPLIRGKESSVTVLHDVVIARNIPTTDALKHEASISVYFSDTQGSTWYMPIKKSWRTAAKTTRALAHAELHTLFPGLREATL